VRGRKGAAFRDILLARSLHPNKRVRWLLKGGLEEFCMSISISAPVQTLSQVNALKSSSATNGAGAIDSLLQMFAGATSQPPSAPSVASGGSNPVSPSNAFDPSTFNALLSIQEKAGGGQAGQIKAPDSSDGQNASSDAEPTTETVTNPDGSITTTLTYSDGTEEVTTTPSVQPVGATATDLATSTVSKSLDELGDLLGPLASAAMIALI
jgi:hypothetical protein